MYLHELTIKILTKAKAATRFKVPNTAVWNRKIGPSPWHRTWSIRSMYITPRDQVVWLKLQHRTLWTPHVGGMGSKECTVHGCHHYENQQHLVECPHIRRDFWDKVQTLMAKLDLQYERNSPKFWITGILHTGKAVEKESAAVIFLAWRALYAESVHTHLNNKSANLSHAYSYLVTLLHGRICAYGLKWRIWYLKQRFIQPQQAKQIPRRYRTHKLYKCDQYGTFHIHPFIISEHKRTLQD